MKYRSPTLSTNKGNKLRHKTAAGAGKILVSLLTKKKTALSLVIPQSRDRNQLILENSITIEFKHQGPTVGNLRMLHNWKQGGRCSHHISTVYYHWCTQNIKHGIRVNDKSQILNTPFYWGTFSKITFLSPSFLSYNLDYKVH